MDKRKLSGFGPVFAYTFKQQAKNVRYLAVTIGFSLLLLLGIGLVMVMVSAPDDDEEVEFNIKEVTVCDKTGLGIPEYAQYAAAIGDEDVSKVSFTSCDDEKKFLKDNEENTDYVLVVQEENEDGFLINIVTSPDTEINGDSLDMLGAALSDCFQTHVYGNSGLSDEALVQALLRVDYAVSDFDEVDTGKEIVTVVVCMLFLFVVYMMVLLYGQQICTEVSMEKTSKLVEQLLVSVTPYGLVAGKIMAVIAVSIIQFTAWIVSILLGIFGGDAAAALMYEGYESKVSVYMDMLKGWFGSMAFGADTVVLAVLLMVFGLVFYLIIAGVAGSMVTKPEDAGNVQVIFVFPLIISFFIVLAAIVQGEGSVSPVFHFIPFVSAMVTPGAVLLGDIPLWVGLISLLVTAIGALLLLLLAAKVYKALLFYTGKKLSLKAIFGSRKKE